MNNQDEKIKEVLNQYATNRGSRIGLDDWAVEEIKKLFRRPVQTTITEKTEDAPR